MFLFADGMYPMFQHIQVSSIERNFGQGQDTDIASIGEALYHGRNWLRVGKANRLSKEDGDQRGAKRAVGIAKSIGSAIGIS